MPGHQNEQLFGQLVGELTKRVAGIAGASAQGFDVITKEDILWRVEREIFNLVLVPMPSRQSDFLEIAFGQAAQRTNNTVERHNAST
jgi:hypothetical protein